MLHIRRDFENMSAEECTAQLVRVMDDDGIRIFTDNPVAYVLGIKEDSSDYVTGTTYMVPHLLITGPAGTGKTSFINNCPHRAARKICGDSLVHYSITFRFDAAYKGEF